MHRSALAKVAKTTVAKRVGARTVVARRVASLTVGSFGGKGKDGKGSAGFKGKGQGPAEGCWTYGGARFSYQCPQNGGDKGQQKGGIRSLCGLQTVPMESDLFNVFRRVGTKYVANISKAVDGKETFYPIVSKVSEKPVKSKMFCKTFGKMC